MATLDNHMLSPDMTYPCVKVSEVSHCSTPVEKRRVAFRKILTDTVIKNAFLTFQQW